VKYSMNKSKRFEVNLYGEPAGWTLAKAWSSKMAHLYGIWLEQDDSEYMFTDADVSSWEQPADYATLLPNLSREELKEASKMLKLRPRRA